MADQDSILIELVGKSDGLVKALNESTKAITEFTTLVSGKLGEFAKTVDSSSKKAAASVKEISKATKETSKEAEDDVRRLSETLRLIQDVAKAQAKVPTTIKPSADAEKQYEAVKNNLLDQLKLVQKEAHPIWSAVAKDAREALLEIRIDNPLRTQAFNAAESIVTSFRNAKKEEQGIIDSLSRQRSAASYKEAVEAQRVEVRAAEQTAKAKKELQQQQSRETLAETLKGIREENQAKVSLERQASRETLSAKLKDLREENQAKNSLQKQQSRESLAESLKNLREENQARESLAKQRSRESLRERIAEIKAEENLTEQQQRAKVALEKQASRSALEEALKNIREENSARLSLRRQSSREALAEARRALQEQEREEKEAIRSRDALQRQRSRESYKEAVAQAKAANSQQITSYYDRFRQEAAAEREVFQIRRLERQLGLQSDQDAFKARLAAIKTVEDYELTTARTVHAERIAQLKIELEKQKDANPGSVARRLDTAQNEAVRRGLREEHELRKLSVDDLKSLSAEEVKLIEVEIKELETVNKADQARRISLRRSIDEERQKVREIQDSYRQFTHTTISAADAQRILDSRSLGFFQRFQANLAAIEGPHQKLFLTLQRIGGEVERVGQTMHTFGIIAVGALTGVVAEVTSYIEQLRRLSEETGLSFTQTQNLATSFEKFGVSSQEVERGLRQIATHLQEARQQDQGAIDKFRALGISFDDLKAKGFDTVSTLELIRDKLQKMGSAQERVGALSALTGRNTTAFVTALTESTGSLTKVADASLVISEKQAESMDKLGQRVELFKVRVKVAFTEFVGAAAPAVSAILDKVEALIAFFRSLDDETKKGIVNFITYGGALLIVGGALATLIGKFTQFVGLITTIPGLVQSFTLTLTQTGAAMSVWSTRIGLTTLSLGSLVSVVSSAAIGFGIMNFSLGALTESFNKIQDPIKKTIAVIGSLLGLVGGYVLVARGATGAISALGTAIVNMAPAAGSASVALNRMGSSITANAAATGGLIAAIVLLGAELNFFINKYAEHQQKLQKIIEDGANLDFVNRKFAKSLDAPVEELAKNQEVMQNYDRIVQALSTSIELHKNDTDELGKSILETNKARLHSLQIARELSTVPRTEEESIQKEAQLKKSITDTTEALKQRVQDHAVSSAAEIDQTENKIKKEIEAQEIGPKAQEALERELADTVAGIRREFFNQQKAELVKSGASEQKILEDRIKNHQVVNNQEIQDWYEKEVKKVDITQKAAQAELEVLYRSGKLTKEEYTSRVDDTLKTFNSFLAAYGAERDRFIRENSQIQKKSIQEDLQDSFKTLEQKVKAHKATFDEIEALNKEFSEKIHQAEAQNTIRPGQSKELFQKLYDDINNLTNQFNSTQVDITKENVQEILAARRSEAQQAVATKIEEINKKKEKTLGGIAEEENALNDQIQNETITRAEGERQLSELKLRRLDAEKTFTQEEAKIKSDALDKEVADTQNAYNQLLKQKQDLDEKIKSESAKAQGGDRLALLNVAKLQQESNQIAAIITSLQNDIRIKTAESQGIIQDAIQKTGNLSMQQGKQKLADDKATNTALEQSEINFQNLIKKYQVDKLDKVKEEANAEILEFNKVTLAYTEALERSKASAEQKGKAVEQILKAEIALREQIATKVREAYEGEASELVTFLDKEGAITKDNLESMSKQLESSIKESFAQLGPEATINGELGNRIKLYETIQGKIEAINKETKKGVEDFNTYFHHFDLGQIANADSKGIKVISQGGLNFGGDDQQKAGGPLSGLGIDFSQLVNRLKTDVGKIAHPELEITTKGLAASTKDATSALRDFTKALKDHGVGGGDGYQGKVTAGKIEQPPPPKYTYPKQSDSPNLTGFTGNYSEPGLAGSNFNIPSFGIGV
jgi:hypothetical protein